MKSLRKTTEDWVEVILNYLGKNCIYCNSCTKLHIHHIIPISRGGQNVISNLEVVCIDCHHKLHLMLNKYLPLKLKKFTHNCTKCNCLLTKESKSYKGNVCKNCINKYAANYRRKKFK